MQSLLFLVEDGDAYNRIGNLGMALKRYTALQKARTLIAVPLVDFLYLGFRFSTRSRMINLISTVIRCASSLSTST